MLGLIIGDSQGLTKLIGNC